MLRPLRWAGMRGAYARRREQCRNRHNSSAPQIFNESAKVMQKARAANASNADEYTYLRDEAASRVVSRVCDIRRKFTRALDLGSGSGHIRQALQADDMAWNAIGDLVEYDVYPGCAGTQDESLSTDIPLPDASVGLVLSAAWLHWVNDLPGILREVHRVLVPDGVLLAAMPAGETLRELRIAMQIAETEVAGGIAPHVSPFVRVRDAGSVLGSAGFVMTTVDTEELVVRYCDMWALMRHLRGMGESNAVRERKTHFGRKTFERAAKIYAERFAHPLGGVQATFEICHMIGWKEDQAQQRPLRRGSAEMSLRDLVKD